MDDAVIPVAYAMNASPKRYALFLGAGISISAGLPTGTEASAKMIKAIAKGRGEAIEGGENPESCLEWFRNTFGVPATFDLLMKKLGISDENRSDGLLPFILPCGEDGKPIPVKPSLAHRAIADLVKDGHISTIITTNFDHLLEVAISDATGIPPIVITAETDTTLMSVFPDKCRIVKVNGDFTSKELKITPEDLKIYNSAIADYVKRIGAEYGLIVCGWSGKFDTGLVEIFNTLGTRRYPTFWALRPDGEILRSLNTSLKPIPIQIESADDFFMEIQTIIDRLRIVERRQPLSTQVAIRKVSEALQKPRPGLILTELLHNETDILIDELSRGGYIGSGEFSAPEVFIDRIRMLEQRTVALAAMMATIAYNDDKEYCDLIFDIIERLINVHVDPPFTNVGARKFTGIHSGTLFSDCLYHLRLLPALMVIYSTGIAATKAEHFNMLEAVLTPKIGRTGSYGLSNVPYYEFLNIPTIFGCSDLWVILNRERFGDSGNIFTYTYEIVHRILNHLIPGDNRFSTVFDIFEYILSLAYLKGSPKLDITEFHRRRIPALDTRLNQMTTRSGPPGNLIFPESFHSYFRRFEAKISGTKFFAGNARWFESCQRTYAEFFGVSPIDTGIILTPV
jgi:hypothetical protein